MNKSILGKLKFIAKDSILYGGAIAISRLVNIITIPILARELSEGDYGALDGLKIASTLILALSLFAFDQSSTILAYDDKYKEAKKKMYGQALLAALLNSLLICVVLYIYTSEVLQLYLNTDNFELSFRLILYSIPFMVSFRFTQSILKWNFERSRFLIVTIGNTLFIAIGIILLYVYGSVTIDNYFYLFLFGYIIFGLLGLFYCRSFFKFRFEKKLLVAMVIFGWPFVFDTVILALIPSIDRYFISSYLTLELLGAYAIAYRIGSFLQLPLQGFRIAWGPFIVSNQNTTDAKKIFTTILEVFGILMILAASLVTINSDTIIRIFAGEGFSESYRLILPLTFMVVVEAFTVITGYGIIISKKTYLNTISNLIYLIISAFLIYLFIEKFGLLGVAYGLLIGKVIYFILKTYFSKLNYDQTPRVWKAVILLIVGYTLTFIIDNIPFGELIQNVVFIAVFIIISIIYKDKFIKVIRNLR